MAAAAVASCDAGVTDPALFAVGILARTHGQILWCVSRRDLFAPALAQAGLHPDRVIYAEAGSDTAILACFEEGLRHGGEFLARRFGTIR